MKRFVCGLFVGLCAIPVCEDVMSMLAGWIEVARGKAALRVTKINKEIADIEAEPYEQVSAIGFDYTPEESYDEEDKYLKQRGNHFGF